MTTLPQINLLHGRSNDLRRERLAFAKVQFVMIVILIFYGAILALVFGINAYIGIEQGKNTTAINQAELKLAQLKPVEEKYFLIMSKLGLIKDFLQHRGKSREMLLTIYQTLPAGVELSGITVDDDKKQIVVQAKAQSMPVIIDYLNLVASEIQTSTFRQVTLAGLGRSSDGSYGIDGIYSLNP